MLNLTVWGVCALLAAARHGDLAVATIGARIDDLANGPAVAGRVAFDLKGAPGAYERMALGLMATHYSGPPTGTGPALSDLYDRCASEWRIERELTTPVPWY